MPEASRGSSCQFFFFRHLFRWWWCQALVLVEDNSPFIQYVVTLVFEIGRQGFAVVHFTVLIDPAIDFGGARITRQEHSGEEQKSHLYSRREFHSVPGIAEWR